MRITFVGGPGSGKTTIATQVFSALKTGGHKVEHVHEFVRHDIHAHGIMKTIWEQYRIRQYQKDLEDAIPDVAEYVICDSGTLTPYFYAVQYFDPSEPRQRLVLQDMYTYFINDLFLNRYDLVFYVPLIKGVDLKDGTRYQTNEEIATLDEHMRLIFTRIHKLPNIHHVTSGYDKRLNEVLEKIFLINIDNKSHN